MATSKIQMDQFAGLVYKEATATGVTVGAGLAGSYHTSEITGYQKIFPVSLTVPSDLLITVLGRSGGGRDVSRVDVKNISSSSISNQTITIGYLCKKTN